MSQKTKTTIDLRTLVVSADKRHAQAVPVYTFGGVRQFYDKPRGERR